MGIPIIRAFPPESGGCYTSQYISWLCPLLSLIPADSNWPVSGWEVGRSLLLLEIGLKKTQSRNPGRESPGGGNTCLLVQGKLLKLIMSLLQTQIQHLANSMHNKKKAPARLAPSIFHFPIAGDGHLMKPQFSHLPMKKTDE